MQKHENAGYPSTNMGPLMYVNVYNSDLLNGIPEQTASVWKQAILLHRNM